MFWDVVLACSALLGADALRVKQREGGDFLTMPLTRVSRPGFPSVYAVLVNLLDDLDSAASSFLVDSGSSTLMAEPLPKSYFVKYSSALSLRQALTGERWTVSYERTSMEGVTKHGKICIGKPPAQVCSGDDLGYFQSDRNNGDFMGSVARSQHGILGLAPQASSTDNAHSIDRGVIDELARSGAIKRRAFGFGAHGSEPVMHLGGWDASRAEGAAFFGLSQPSRGKWEIPVDDLMTAQPEPVLPAGLDILEVPSSGSGNDESTAKPLNLCPSGGCRALIDTGTAVLEVSEEALATLQHVAPVRQDCTNMQDMPDLKVAFPGGTTFTISAKDYIVKDGGVTCQLGITAIRKQHWAEMSPPMDPPVLILGESFIRNHYTIFDADGGRIGLVP